MDVNQIYDFVNTATEEALGQSGLVQEDLGNIVDVGTAIANAEAYDKYVKSLVNRIGKTIFITRKYQGNVPSMMYDDWEFGSVLQRIRVGLPEATENESWSLENGQSYDPNIFYKPEVTAKYFNRMTTYEVPISITELQVRQSFLSQAALSGFIECIFNAIEVTMTIKMDELIMRTLNNMIGETLYAEVPGGTYTGRSGAKAVNLLYLYNTRYGTSLSAADAVTTPEFLKFAAYQMSLVASRMTKASSLFNIEGVPAFTPKDDMRCVMLADFSQALGPYLKADTFHDDLISLPEIETVPYWQGSGTSYAFADTSKVYITTVSDHNITATGVLGVLYDKWACGVNGTNRRIKNHEVVKAEFFNYWYKQDARFFNDESFSFVLFYVA